MDKREMLLDAALKIAARKGYWRITRDELAAETRTPSGSVTFILGSVPEIKESVIEHAIARSNLVVIAQALSVRHPIARKAPQKLREAAAASII